MPHFPPEILTLVELENDVSCQCCTLIKIVMMVNSLVIIIHLKKGVSIPLEQLYGKIGIK